MWEVPGSNLCLITYCLANVFHGGPLYSGKCCGTSNKVKQFVPHPFQVILTLSGTRLVADRIITWTVNQFMDCAIGWIIYGPCHWMNHLGLCHWMNHLCTMPLHEPFMDHAIGLTIYGPCHWMNHIWTMPLNEPFMDHAIGWTIYVPHHWMNHLWTMSLDEPFMDRAIGWTIYGPCH
jgi:hypothetical protein